MARPTFIFDLDGTIANIQHRRHFVRSKPRNWKAFHSCVSQDTPNEAVIAIMRAFKATGVHITICSGRDGETYDETVEWLARHGVPYDVLRMRPVKNYVPDTDLKEQWLKEILDEGFEVIGVVDDRVGVVDMWRRHGLFVLDVNQTREVF